MTTTRTNPLNLLFGGTSGLVLGKSQTVRGHTTKIRYPESSTYIIGAKGTGKSTLMLNMFLQEIAKSDKALVLLDPHGDLAEDVIQRCPAKHANRVTYFAPTSKEQRSKPFGLNPFEEILGLNGKHQFDAIMKVFSHSWFLDFDKAPVMQNSLETMSRILLASYKKHRTSFLDFFLMMRRDEIGQLYRKLYLNDISDNPAVLYNLKVWENQSTFIKATESSFNKINHLINDEIILHILSQRESSKCFDFLNMIRRKGVLVVNLGGMDDESCRLLGSLILTLLTATVKSIDNKNDRLPCHIYADEFYKFSPESFVEIINECRKFGLATTIAHQTLAQLMSSSSSAAFSCGNMISLRVASSDELAILKNFRPITREIYDKLPRYHAMCKIQLEKSAPETSITKINKPAGKPSYDVERQIIQNSLRFGTDLNRVKKDIRIRISDDKLKNSDSESTTSKHNNKPQKSGSKSGRFKSKPKK